KEKERLEREQFEREKSGAVDQTEGPESRPGPDEHADDDEHVDGDGDHLGEQIIEDFSNLTGRQKRLFELRLKMNEARKANQMAMVAEKKK
ncbi:hypothetical protein INN88_14700, partial [Staphylococcus aureus]|nr:hypothetical protein [Staphylococcus aureus]